MTNTSDKVLISDVNQPVTMTFPHINLSAVEAIKNSMLYNKAENVLPDTADTANAEKLLLASTVTTNGWDTVSICRVSALNERIKKEKTYPKAVTEKNNALSVEGEFDPWQITPGGDGRNVKIRVPMKNGTYKGMDIGKGDCFDLTGISVDIYVKLDYFPLPDTKDLKDGSYNLYVNTTGSGENTDPIAAVIALHDPKNRIDTINQSILRGLFESWLNRPENLKQFDTLFSTVVINNMGKQSDEFKWLKATAISYAYTDQNTENSSIFGILCMTNNRSREGLHNQLPAVALESDDNAVFLISREVFIKNQLLPALPYIFTESPEASYNLDKTGLVITAKNLKMDAVKVGAIYYHPVAESFEITFSETSIETSAQIHTPISPGIDANTLIITKQTLSLSTNKKGEQIMVYEMVGDPYVKHSTDVATGVIVTEAILALIAAVVTGIAGAVAGKITALIVGIIAAAVVSIVSVSIHAIIEKVISGKATDALPSISPMVKVASNQVKWPFCEPDAFSLTDIEYLGSIMFKGSLKLAKGYTIVNNRLTYDALSA